jgi:acyl-coenzyme A thioesterase PaaI-like protein
MLTSARRAELMAMLDGAMTKAAQSRLSDARDVVAVDVHVAFLRHPVGAVQARAHTTGGGRSVCFCEATLVDAAGEVAAQAMGTFRSA